MRLAYSSAKAMAVAGAIVLVGCEARRDDARGEAASAPPADSWLRGDVEERLAQVAKHLRGLDVAMIETGYRYSELYWAGRDQNWEYAAYQVDKIATAVGLALERRPRRAASAAALEVPLERLRSAIAQRDPAGFDDAFTTLTATCNSCHLAEQFQFVEVAPPATRSSPLRSPAPAGPEPAP